MKLTSWNSYNLQRTLLLYLELIHLYDSVDISLCFLLSCVARVILPLVAVVFKCFSFRLIIGKILTFVFQGNYATLFIILFIAITLLKSLFYILVRSRKPEESELPPYSPLEEHLKEGIVLVGGRTL